MSHLVEKLLSHNTIRSCFSHKFRNIRKHLKEYNGDLKTLHRIQELEYDAIIDELGEGGDEE